MFKQIKSFNIAVLIIIAALVIAAATNPNQETQFRAINEIAKMKGKPDLTIVYTYNNYLLFSTVTLGSGGQMYSWGCFGIVTTTGAI